MTAPLGPRRTQQPTAPQCWPKRPERGWASSLRYELIPPCGETDDACNAGRTGRKSRSRTAIRSALQVARAIGTESPPKVHPPAGDRGLLPDRPEPTQQGEGYGSRSRLLVERLRVSENREKAHTGFEPVPPP